MNREQRMSEIVTFVGRHQESQATRSICRRLLPEYDGKIDGSTLLSLQQNLLQVDDQAVESCYDLVR